MGGQLVEFPFAAGLDEGTDPRRTPKFLAVNNYVWTKQGRLEKRNGYEVLSSSVAGGARVVTSTSVTTGGSGYSALSPVLTTGGGGTGFLGLATVTSAGVVTSVSTIRAGYGFTSAPALNFSSGTGSGATGTTTITPANTATLANTYTIRPTPQGQLQTTDGSSIYVLSGSTWDPIGALSSLSTTTVPTPLKAVSIDDVPNASTDYQNWHIVACGPYYVWVPLNRNSSGFGSTGVYVEQASSGAPVPTNNGIQTGTNGFRPVNGNVVTDGSTYVWKFYTQPNTPQNIGFTYVDCTDPNQPQEILDEAFPINATPVTFDGFFDVFYDAPRSRLVVAYVAHLDTNVTIGEYTWVPIGATPAHWTLTGTTTISITSGATTYNSMQGMAVTVSPAGHIQVAWAYETGAPHNLVVRSIDLSFGSIATLFTTLMSTGSDSIWNLSIVGASPTGYFVAFTTADWGITAAASTVNCVRSYSVDFSGVVLSGTITNCCTLMSRLYLQDGHPHAMVIVNASPAYAVLDLYPGGGDAPASLQTPGTMLSYLNPRTALSPENGREAQSVLGNGCLPTAVAIGANRWLIPITQAPEPGESTILMLQKAMLTYHSPVNAPVNEWTGLLYPAGVPSIAGATSVRETNFVAPPIIIGHSTTGGSGSLSTGTYSWISTYARFNDDGSITESQPSNPITISCTANDLVDLTITTYSYGGLQSSDVPKGRFSVVLYRTLVNQGDSYFRVTLLSTDAGKNVTGANSVDIADGAPDTVIDSQPQLYTDGGIFDNVCPPATSIAARVRDRAYLAGTPDGFTVYYSDPVTNVGAANFHDEQTITIDDDGPITGISEIDTNVAIFKEQAIYVVFGSEGTNTGAGNTLSAPVSLPSGGIGCIAPKSIAYGQDGVYFQSARGIELLKRDLSVSFIGESVKDETSGNAIVATVLVPEQYQVRFYLSDWTTLVLSTLNGEWSKFGYGNRPVVTLSDATISGSVVYWCGAGAVMAETVGAYGDNGTAIACSFQSGWFTLGSLEGYRRTTDMQILGTWFDVSAVTMALAVDYATTPMQVGTWTTAELEALPEFNANRVQLGMALATQKAEAVQVTLVDFGPDDGSLTKGIGWDAFAFEVVQKPGRYRKLSAGATR
jgi:hypothetical protein